MCDPDIHTSFFLYDRVINVRLGSGVPIGTRGTVIGIMHGRTHLDTYYEILFDNLPSNSLDTILLGKNQQKCRIKVHSYHLLNYSHSLRLRSANYQQQRSVPSSNVNEQQPFQQTSTVPQQQSTRTVRRDSNDNNKGTKPKSAPPLNKQERPNFAQVKEQTPITNNPRSSLTSTETPKQPFASKENSSGADPSMQYQSFDSPMSAQQVWSMASSQDSQPSCI
jgi:hypothetical protein